MKFEIDIEIDIDIEIVIASTLFDFYSIKQL